MPTERTPSVARSPTPATHSASGGMGSPDSEMDVSPRSKRRYRAAPACSSAAKAKCGHSSLSGTTSRRPCRSAASRSACGSIRSRRGCVARSEEHTSELQSLAYLVCRLLLEKKKKIAFFLFLLKKKKNKKIKY